MIVLCSFLRGNIISLRKSTHSYSNLKAVSVLPSFDLRGLRESCWKQLDLQLWEKVCLARETFFFWTDSD